MKEIKIYNTKYNKRKRKVKFSFKLSKDLMSKIYGNSLDKLKKVSITVNLYENKKK